MRIDRPEDYYQAGVERMKQAWILYREEDSASFALAMYTSGVAVEAMLRAFKLLRDPTFDEKHDLKRLLKSSGMLNINPDLLRARGLTEEQARDHFIELQRSLHEVYIPWANDYRFAFESRLKANLKQRQLDRGVKGDFVKGKALSLLGSAQRFIDRGA